MYLFQIPVSERGLGLLPSHSTLSFKTSSVLQILAKKLQRLQQKISKEEASAGGMKIEVQVCQLAI